LEGEVGTMKTLAQRRQELLGVIYLLKREVNNLREPGLALLPARATNSGQLDPDRQSSRPR
jgi:hypothetical protein